MNLKIVSKVKIILLLLVVSQLFNISCTKHVYRESSFGNVKSSSEKRKLNAFMNSGTEKKINTYNIGADDIIFTAKKYLGVPHCMGGTTMKCIDCSGLVLIVFAKHGINLPHSSEEQAKYGKIISGTNKLIKGDLVFFVRSYRTSDLITHTGIYLGDDKFIHTSTKKGVTITSLSDPWWKEKFIFGTRLLE
jgi:murein DD-endopeptidase / murein LD-carboxypeptidase